MIKDVKRLGIRANAHLEFYLILEFAGNTLQLSATTNEDDVMQVG